MVAEGREKKKKVVKRPEKSTGYFIPMKYVTLCIHSQKRRIPPSLYKVYVRPGPTKSKGMSVRL